MISDYAVVLQNLASGRTTIELPVSKATATAAKNGAGGLKVDLPLKVDGLTKAMVESRRNAAFLLRDGRVVGEGIIDSKGGDVENNALSLNCVGWHEYTSSQFLKRSVAFAGTDQATIVKELVDYIATKSGALRFDTTGIVATGVQRDRRWLAHERQNIGKLIDNLADVINGFTFRYESSRAPGAPGFTTRILIGYPATGRVTRIVFDMQANVELLSFDENGSQMANSCEYVGSGQSDLAPRATAIDTNVLRTTPLWESVDTLSDVTFISTLNEYAQRRLTLGRDPVTVPKLRLDTNGDPKLGEYLVGDRVRVRGEYGVLDIDADYIIERTNLVVSPDAEYVDVDVAPVGSLI